MDTDVPQIPEVVINGTRYIPATTAAAGAADLLRVLALQYDTEESLAEYGMVRLRVVVGDASEFEAGEGETFDELAARLAATAQEA
jgi:hypothetical protein